MSRGLISAVAWISPDYTPVMIKLVGNDYVVADVGDEDSDVRVLVPISEAAAYIFQREVAQ